MVNGVDKYSIEYETLMKLDIGSVSNHISDNLVKCLFILVTLTMFHLYLGLAYVNQNKTMEDVHKLKKKADWIFYSVFACIILSAIVLLVFYNEDQ